MEKAEVEKIAGILKPGQAALFNEEGSVCLFDNLVMACKNAVNHDRSPQNGWNIVDDLGVTYEKKDWAFLATL